MRYFLDTEFNGFGGELISIALVPEYGDQEFYAVVPLAEEPHPWVARHVIPYLAAVPPGMSAEPISRGEVARELALFLHHDDAPLIVADWPDDIAYFCKLLMTGPGQIVAVGNLRFLFMSNGGISTAENSRVPHNALHDARALREHVLAQTEGSSGWE
jgi:hypothetical protein